MTTEFLKIHDTARLTPASLLKKEKAFSATAGTVCFFAACLLLVVGLCRFSSYILKNHRSVVTRDDLVKTYVDVQPYEKKTPPVYAALRETPPIPSLPVAATGRTPASVTQKAAVNPSPLPAVHKDIRPVSVTAADSRPVIRTVAIQNAANPEVKNVTASVSAPVYRLETPQNTLSAPTASDGAVSLDDLVVSGVKAFDDMASVQEEDSEDGDAFAFDEDLSASFARTAVTETAARKPAAEPVQASRPTVFKEKAAGQAVQTVWLDPAALRRAIMQEEQSRRTVTTGLTDENRIENFSLLNMGGTQQFAHAEPDVVSDVIEKEAETMKKTPERSETKAETAKNGEKEDGEGVLASAGRKEDRRVRETVRSKLSRTQRKTAESLVETESLWKVATVNGKPHNKMAVRTPETADEKIVAIKNLAREESEGDKNQPEYIEVRSDSFSGAPTKPVIYKNGRPVLGAPASTKTAAKQSGEQEKRTNLNWMDRQQAAVWTSMVQSDAPSVWGMSLSSGTKSPNPETAKAFKVADVSPAPEETVKSAESQAKDDVITSAQVRVVGETQKPEAKKSPLLLPLGTQTPTVAAAPVPPVGISPVQPQAVAAIPQAAQPAAVNPIPVFTNPQESAQTQTPDQAAVDDGIVGKIKSLFSSSDVSPELPSLGASSSSSLPDLNKKNASRKKASADKKRKKSARSSAEDDFAKMESNAKKGEGDPLPSEIRLTFKPGNAEISAQSVKWVKGFGNRAKKDIQRGIEIRMSHHTPELQEKRFALIRSILLGTGMEPTQLFPVMTDRTPHTIVLRAFDIPEEGYEEYTSAGDGVEERIYFRQW